MNLKDAKPYSELKSARSYSEFKNESPKEKNFLLSPVKFGEGTLAFDPKSREGFVKLIGHYLKGASRPGRYLAELGLGENAYNPEPGINKTFGTDNPGFVGEGIELLSEYMNPRSIASGALSFNTPQNLMNIASQIGRVPAYIAKQAPDILAMSGLGFLSNPENRAGGAATGAATAVAAPVVFEGLKSVGKMVANKTFEIAKPYANAQLVEQLGKWIGNYPKGIVPAIRQEEKRITQEVEKPAWEKVEESAVGADVMAKEYEEKIAENKIDEDLLEHVPDFSFSNTSYENALTRKINSLTKEAEKYPNKADDNYEIINLLEDFKQHPINTWEDAIKARQAINASYSTTPGNASKAVNFAVKSFDKNVNNQLDKHGMNSFKNSWEEANRITSEKKQTFENFISDTTQKSSRSPYMNAKRTEEQIGATPDLIIEQYIPTDIGQGTAKMEQFSRMVGGQEKASPMLRDAYFKDAIVGDKINLNTAFDKYKKLSSDQKEFLFTPHEKKILDEGSKLYEKNPAAYGEEKAGTIVKILRHPYTHGIAGAVAGSAGGISGLAVGSGLGLIASGIARKYGKEAANWYVNKGGLGKASDLYTNIIEAMAKQTPYLLHPREKKKND